MLPPSWEFDFVDAPFDCNAAPELTGIYPGPYHCFFDKYSEENMSQAVDFVREVVDEDGPYDCIMGFSQVCQRLRRLPFRLLSRLLSRPYAHDTQ